MKKYVYFGEHWFEEDDDTIPINHCAIEVYNILDLVKEMRERRYALISINKECALFKSKYTLFGQTEHHFMKYYIA